MNSQKSNFGKTGKHDDDVDKSGDKVNTRQEAREKADKRERETEQEKEMKTARNQGMIDVSSPGASSPHQAVAPVPRCVTNGERTLDEACNEDEAPDKVQKILSICIGQWASDKRGEVGAEAYTDDLKAMAEEYRDRDSLGECFVHIRKQHSSNKDLRALRALTKSGEFYKVNLGGGEAESMLTNSAKLPNIIEASNCSSSAT